MSKRLDRRGFLKKSLAGVSGVALAPAVWPASPRASGAQTAPATIPSLPGRPLGRTGIETPLISMGTSEVTSVDLIRRGYDAGIKIFFSATYYGRGNNERLVGEALRSLPRESFVVGTAATPEGLNPRAGTLPKDLTAQSYMKTAEDSLKRFGLDRVDILLLPFADLEESVLSEQILAAMTELKKQGKIRFAGIATHGARPGVLQAAVQAKIYDVAMVAYNFKSANKDALAEAMASAAKAGMGVVAMKTTAGVARDKSGADPMNINAALKWVLQNPNVASIVSGMSSVEELQRNLEMLKDPALTVKDLADLDAACDPAEPGLYCQQCRTCLPQCPKGLDIPTLMRSYMYAYGYRNLGQARAALDTVEVDGGTCETCGVCSVRCASGFDVKDRIQDIVRLKDVPLEFLKGRMAV